MATLVQLTLLIGCTSKSKQYTWTCTLYVNIASEFIMSQLSILKIPKIINLEH